MMRSIVAAAAVGLFATPAFADPQLFVRMGSMWVTDPSLDLFGEVDALPQVVLGGGFGGDALSFEVAYAFSGSSATSFQVVETNLLVHQFQGALLYRMPLGSGLHATARGAASFVLGTIDIGEVRQLEDMATGLGLEGTLGTELRLPVAAGADPWATTLGFSVEAGYGWHPMPLTFGEARVGGDDEARPAPLSGGAVDVGSLDLSGPLLRFGVALQF